MNRKRQNKQQVLALKPKDRGEAGARRRGDRTIHGEISHRKLGFQRTTDGGGVRPREPRKSVEAVKRNKGSPGVHGMTVDDVKVFLRQHWPNIRSQMLDGNYRPQPVKRVEIPKPDGGVRKLGVPCVVDRLIQQAVLQVLQERWDPTFSEHSLGFRPGRSAH